MSNSYNPSRDKEGKFATGAKSPVDMNDLIDALEKMRDTYGLSQEEHDATVRAAHEAFTSIIAARNEERNSVVDESTVAERNREQVIEILRSLDDEGFYGSPRLVTDYSGRSMYGEECPGLIVNDESQLLEFHAELAIVNPALAEQMRTSARRDSMGLGIVEYYPGVNLGSGSWDTDEGEEYDDLELI